MGVVWQYEVAESSGDHDANVEFDLQLQVKYYLLGQIITTLVCLGNARRLLEGCVPADAALQRGSDDQKPLAGLYVAVIQRNAAAARRLLPAVLKWLEKRPLLYVPFDHGGTPEPILRAQTVQSLIRFLLRELPQMGLLRETWHVLHTAFRMERRWRPEGQAITEFDRLFHLALRSSLETLLASSRKWRSGRFSHDELIDAVSELVEPYQSLWLKHSGTMRLSSVDGLRSDEDWAELADFIHEYGAEFFHPSRLTLGNVRAILHHGVDQYLAFLEENEDPLHPLKLLEDVHGGRLDRADAEWCLETVYSIVVDRFDRFLEYNTTTTQSDYGEMFFCLLEFLRVEARYDRDAWSMVPLTIVHEMLARHGRRDAASVWDATFEVQTTDLADQHLADMDALSQRYGVAMPTIRDHLNQRFVKPLAVNRMVALVAESVQDAKAGRAESESFARLQTEVDQYMVDSWGSGVDVPAWLRTVEHEVEEVTWPDEGGRPGAEAELRLPLVTLTLREFRQQLRDWKEPLEPSPLKGTPRTEQERPASEKRSGNQKQNRRKRRPS
jgi:hypothetical protein